MIVVQLKTYEQTRQVTASELEMMMSDPKHKAAVKAIHDLGDKYHASEDQSTPEAKELKKAMTKKKAFLPSAIFQVSEFKVHEWIDSDKKNHGYGILTILTRPTRRFSGIANLITGLCIWHSRHHPITEPRLCWLPK